MLCSAGEVGGQPHSAPPAAAGAGPVVLVTLWLPLSMDRPIGLKLLHHVFWHMIILIVNSLLDKEWHKLL